MPAHFASWFHPRFCALMPAAIFMEDTNSLIEQRRTKLKSLEAKGIFPFQNKFTPDTQCNVARSGFEAGTLPEGHRVSVAGFLVNDLLRDAVACALIWLPTRLLGANRLTRHDAPASVRQAYTPKEMEALLAQTSASRTEVHRHYLFRMGVIAWK